VIYRQTVRQPDQNSDFYTTGLVEAHQHLDAFHLKVALDHAAAVIPVFPVTAIQGPGGRWKKRPAKDGRTPPQPILIRLGTVARIPGSRSRNRIGPGRAGRH
jgi:hypothetical protein